MKWFANRHVCSVVTDDLELSASVEFRRGTDGDGWDWVVGTPESEAVEDVPFIAHGREATLAKAKAAASRAMRSATGGKS